MADKLRLSGKVVSNSMDKTVVVEVTRTVPHPVYKKRVHRSNKFYAHVENEIEVGTEVVIEESKPISKTKRWRVVEVKNSEEK